MAKALLASNASSSARPRQSAYALSRLKLLAERMGRGRTRTFQDQFARLRLELKT
jgi:hypothetical protein